MKINTELQDKIIARIEEVNRSNIRYTEEEFYVNREEIRADLIKNLADYSDRKYFEDLEDFNYDEYLETTLMSGFFMVNDHCQVSEVLNEFIPCEDVDLLWSYELDYLTIDVFIDASHSR